MAKKIFSHILILIIHFILWTVSCYAQDTHHAFTLDTTHYIQHKPILADAVKISGNMTKNMNIADVMPKKISGLGQYCIQKKRRGLYLQNDDTTQNYITVRGGVTLNYTDCDTGHNAHIKIKRHNIYGFYQIKF